MKGDFTRETFRSQRHYWGVLRQQGRVDIDADWNEQVRIARHQDVVQTADVVGPAGGPINGAGFDLQVDAATGAVRIGAGRYYVGGVLCENETPVGLTAQPDPPGDAAPGAAGFHLAYLDVWDRHVSALDDPTIREVALGGPDTATRARTVWQVRTQALMAANAAFTAAVAALAAARTAGDAAAEVAAMQELRELATAASCAAPLVDVGGSLAADTGTMAARTVGGAEAADPCRFDPGGGGYTRLENRLYRVEIHDPGDDTTATYKWSRDNGSVVVSVEEFRNTGGGAKTTEIVVRRLGLDSSQELNRDDWIEIVSDDLVARGVPGQLVQIAAQPDPADRILLLKSAVDIKALELHPQVRRWDLPVGGLTDVRKTWHELEAGIEVRFGVGEYHTGDYWVIPARANTADVEWPPLPEYPGHVPAGPPEQLRPRGIAHWRAPIAALVHDGTRLVASVDLRALFPAATDLMDFAYAGGDGQMAKLPAGEVPQPLQVSVTNGLGPVTGVLVEFTVVAGTSSLTGGGQTGTTVQVPTDAGGLASVAWTVDTDVVDHRVAARLLDDCATPTRAPIFFSARVNYQLHYLGGDGQEGMPGEVIRPLRVWVSDGRWPATGAQVRFTLTEGTGTLTPSGPTDADGIAECGWELDSVTPRQQVTAELVDAARTPIHVAALTFTANLSLASTVSYTPAGDCSDLSGAGTVQEALDELCRREGGGDCTYTIRAGDDVEARFAEIQASTFRDGAICFAEGVWEIKAPLTLTDKGDVTIRGLGRASRIVARQGETAIRLDHCASVTVTDLAIMAEHPTPRDGLGGGLSVVDSGPVTVERLAVVAPSGPEPLVSGIAVTRGPRAVRSGPIRIHDCDLETGEQQTGILVVNGDVVRIEGNTLRAAPFPEGTRLREYLANARYRAAARRELVDPRLELEEVPTTPAAPAAPDEPVSPERRDLDAGRVVRMTVGDAGERVMFRSTMTSGDVWTSLLRGSATTRREALATAASIADTVLRNEGALEGRRVFRTWFEEIEAKWQATGARGIVIGGKQADDVRIVGNAISGHLQGISVALSDDNRQLYLTAVAVIEGNTIVLPGWSLVAPRTEGIFLGSAGSAIVDGNTVIVGGGVNSEPEILADGVHAGGAFGARLLLRSNHFDAAIAGIRVELARPAPPPHTRRWVASDNINVGGACLEAPCEVMEDANVPARPKPGCLLDRPI